MTLPPAFAALQTAQLALDLANRRVKELELACGTLDERLSGSNNRTDAAELALWQSGMLDEAGQVALNDPANRLKKRRDSAHRRAH
jgi:hypothetical protein